MWRSPTWQVLPGRQSRSCPRTHRRGQPLRTEALNAENAPESAIGGVLQVRSAPTGSVLWLVLIPRPRKCASPSAAHDGGHRASDPAADPSKYRFFQVTLLQVAYLQWVATDAILGLVASNSGLSLPPSSRPAGGVLTIDAKSESQSRKASNSADRLASWEQGQRRQHGKERTGADPRPQSNRMKSSTPMSVCRRMARKP